MSWFNPVSWVEDGFDYAKEKASDAWDGVKETASDAWDGAKETVSDGLDTLGNAVSAAPKTIIHLGGDAIDAISHPIATINAAKGLVEKGVDATGTFFHGSATCFISDFAATAAAPGFRITSCSPTFSSLLPGFLAAP